MVNSALGPGAPLACFVTGAGTSIGAVIGLFVIAHTRFVAITTSAFGSSPSPRTWLDRPTHPLNLDAFKPPR